MVHANDKESADNHDQTFEGKVSNQNEAFKGMMNDQNEAYHRRSVASLAVHITCSLPLKFAVVFVFATGVFLIPFAIFIQLQLKQHSIAIETFFNCN